MQVCLDCHVLTHNTRCPEHESQRNRQRGSSTARGYGVEHRALRAHWQGRMDEGLCVECWRCGVLITGAWQLGHCDDNRATYHGPEHEGCNLATAGRGRCGHPSHRA